MGYLNSSWDMGPNQKGFGSANFLGPDPGAGKVDPPENLIISKLGFFYFGPKFWT